MEQVALDFGNAAKTSGSQPAVSAVHETHDFLENRGGVAGLIHQLANEVGRLFEGAQLHAVLRIDEDQADPPWIELKQLYEQAVDEHTFPRTGRSDGEPVP